MFITLKDTLIKVDCIEYLEVVADTLVVHLLGDRQVVLDYETPGEVQNAFAALVSRLDPSAPKANASAPKPAAQPAEPAESKPEAESAAEADPMLEPDEPPADAEGVMSEDAQLEPMAMPPLGEMGGGESEP